MKHFGKWFLALVLLTLGEMYAVESPSISEMPEDIVAQPTPDPSSPDLPNMKDGPEPDDVTMSKLEITEPLSWGLAFDTNFSTGGPAQQGFYIPFFRLTAHGQITQFSGYRLSVGQTREFASLLLPQLLPVEAYLIVGKPPTSLEVGPSSLVWKVGLFTPTAHPWWSSDLSMIDFPDYLESHRALFLSRDVGTELSYGFGSAGFTVGVGAFNGNGIFGLNTNNSRSFVGFAEKKFYFGEAKLNLGINAVTVLQSTRGAINFRSSWSASCYAILEIPSSRLKASLEGFGGAYDDNTLNLIPRGGAVSFSLGLAESLNGFARYELLMDNPLLATDSSHFEGGVRLMINSNLSLFSYYDQLMRRDQSAESSFQVRARLVL